MEFVYKIDKNLPPHLCKSIIKRFKEDDKKHQGRLGPGIINLNVKKCTDLQIMLREDWKDVTETLTTCLASGSQEYFRYIENNVFVDKNLQVLAKIFGDNIECKGFQIQQYKSGDKFEWHTDDAYDQKRLLAFIWYLNTVKPEDGGSTEFLNGKYIQPTEGSILFFPATWSYVHKGNVIKNGEKYIITGFIIQSNLKICDESST